MTLKEIMDVTALHPWIVLSFFAALPLTAFVLGLTHKKNEGERGARSYIYATLVYLSCMPGIFAICLILYSLLFTRQNLLEVNLLIYAAPLVSMVLTLFVISRKVKFEKVPGFDRLSGFILLLSVTFAVLFLLSRTRIWLLFGGSFIWLIALGAAVFLLLKKASMMAFKNTSN